jgi:rSAM/selenodomain-associated transferase 2
MRLSVSIIIPVLNEEASIAAALGRLADAQVPGVEILVVDGGSDDASVSRALPLSDAVIIAPRGRAAQMNAGAKHARGDILLFLHADTRLPDNWRTAVLEGLAEGTHDWGRFDVSIEGSSIALPVIAAMMNLRSRWTGIATGDQAIFVRRDTFEAVGGFPEILLMEDIAVSKLLKRFTPPVCLKQKVETSGRRWEKNGVLRTIVMMWRLRLLYWCGTDPATLARHYGYTPREDRQ